MVTKPSNNSELQESASATTPAPRQCTEQQKAEGIVLEDGQIAQQVHQQLKLPHAAIPYETLQEIEELDVGGTSTSLNGIECMHSLKQLRVSLTGSVDLSPLASLRQLQELQLAGRFEGDLNLIGELPLLRSLHLGTVTGGSLAPLARFHQLEALGFTPLTPADVAIPKALSKLRLLSISTDYDLSALGLLSELRALHISGCRGESGAPSLGSAAKLASLEELKVDSCRIEDWEFLRGTPGLRRLHVGEVPRSANLTALQSLKSLESLVIDRGFTDGALIAPLSQLQRLRLYDSDVLDLSFLAQLKALRELDLSFGKFSDIGPLRKLNQLRALKLYSAKQVKDWTPLANLTALEELDIGSTNVQSIKMLANLVSLKKLSIGFNNLRDIGPLRNLKNLEELEAEGIPAADLKPLSQLHQLRRVMFWGGAGYDIPPRDLSPLINLPKLEELHVSGELVGGLHDIGRMRSLTQLALSSVNLADYASLSQLKQLTFLHISNSNIKSLQPLSGLNQLVQLEMRSNEELSDLSGVEALQSLRFLTVNGSVVQDISPLRHLALRTVELAGNRITDTSPLANQGDLIELIAPRNRIVRVGTLTAPLLQRVTLNDNSLTELDVSHLPRLTELSVSNNQLRQIRGLDKVFRLITLDVSSNQFRTLGPAKHLKAIVTLRAGDNLLRYLPKLPLARVVEVPANRISDISRVKYSTRLEVLDLSKNNISQVTPLRNLSPLTRLDLRDNPFTDPTPLVPLHATTVLELPSHAMTCTDEVREHLRVRCD